MSSLTYGNGLAGSISYDNQYRVASITAGTVMNLTYADDANGNITSITNNLDPTKNKAFTYDTFDRLSNGDRFQAFGAALARPYDGVGNRQTEGSNTYAYIPNTNKLQ